MVKYSVFYSNHWA